MNLNKKFCAASGTVFLVLLAGNLAGAKAQPPSAAPAKPAAAAPAADTPASTAPTLSVDARLVNIPVVVHDKKGALVQTLTKDSFVLQIDGKPQEIRYFNLDTDLPLTLGLLVDTSMSQRDVIGEERTASEAFLDDMLTGPADRDKAFIVQFARQTDLLQDVTSSKPKLQAGLKQLDTPSFGGGNSRGSQTGSGSDPDDNNNSGSSNGQGHRAGGGTTLYDALFLSSDELMGKQKGRKAVIILSDGVDSGSKETLGSAIEAAQRADTIVYAIYYKGKESGYQNNQNQGNPGRRGGGYPGGGYPGGGYPGGGYPGGGGGYPGGGRGGQRQPEAIRPDGKKILQRMADETGGELFEVSKKDTLESIYKEIGAELRAQYRLGYTPDKDTASDGYHRIVLSFSKSSPKDLFIQTRDGYYAGSQ
jgi:VWFA-related protein